MTFPATDLSLFTQPSPTLFALYRDLKYLDGIYTDWHGFLVFDIGHQKFNHELTRTDTNLIVGYPVILSTRRMVQLRCPCGFCELTAAGKGIAVFPALAAGIALIALGLHSPFPLPGGRLGCELLHHSEVARTSLFPFSSVRLIGKSCISHTHSTFVGLCSMLNSLLNR